MNECIVLVVVYFLVKARDFMTIEVIYELFEDKNWYN